MVIQLSSNRKVSDVSISSLNFDIQTVQRGPEAASGDATVLIESVTPFIYLLL